MTNYLNNYNKLKMNKKKDINNYYKKKKNYINDIQKYKILIIKKNKICKKSTKNMKIMK